MNVHPIIMWPEPWLQKVSVPVLDSEFNSPELLELATALVDTMRIASGVGISAPQLGVLKEVIVVPGADKKWLVLCNPQLEPVGEAKAQTHEGCLSLPTVALPIHRYASVRVKAKTPEGVEVEHTFTGLSAIVAQHEADHLRGITIADSVGPTHQRLLKDKLKKVLRRMRRSEQKLAQNKQKVLEKAREVASDPNDYAIPAATP